MIQYGSNNGKYIPINNTELYYEEYGKGTPLLMLHGGTVSISSFRNVIPDLSKQFRVIAVDTPGHGRSQQAPTMTYPLMADYFSKFIDALRLDSVYVIGWSDGGIIAMLLAADRPEKIKRVIASGAQFDQNGYTELGRQFIKNVNLETIEKEWGSWVANYKSNAYKTNDWKNFITDLIKMWSAEVYVPAEKVKRIKARFLTVLGDRDIISITHGDEMHEAIKGSELLVLPNTSHSVFKERPELFNTFAIEFLTKD